MTLAFFSKACSNNLLRYQKHVWYKGKHRNLDFNLPKVNLNFGNCRLDEEIVSMSNPKQNPCLFLLSFIRILTNNNQEITILIIFSCQQSKNEYPFSASDKNSPQILDNTNPYVDRRLWNCDVHPSSIGRSQMQKTVCNPSDNWIKLKWGSTWGPFFRRVTWV